MKRFLWLLCALIMVGCSPAAPEAAIVAETIIEQPPIPQPQNSGMDEALLAQIPTYADEALPNLYSVLVLRYGDVVYEEYFNGRGPDSADIVFSVTKSIMSTLIGIAIDEGDIESVDQTVGDYLSDQISSADERLAGVTIRQLLTMNSGIYCGNDRCYDHSLFDTLGKKLLADPGERFVYDTGASHLLSGILQEAVGMTAEEYAQQRIFDPLEFDNINWDADPDGYSFGGVGIAMRSRDMAKFGELFLRNGVWNGEQLVSAEYIAEATSPQIGTNSDLSDYGYLWWVPRDIDPPMYQAVGYGGQYITVVPEYELVIVITGGFSAGPNNKNFDIISDFVLPAVRDR